MPDVLVRNVDDDILERLKARAMAKHRSLQAELQVILSHAAQQTSCEDIQERASALRKRLGGRTHTDSSELLAEDRAR